MVRKKKKLSRIITIRLLLAVFITFFVSSAVIYCLLSVFAAESAMSLLSTASNDIYFEIKEKSSEPLTDYVYESLFRFAEEGEAGALEQVKGTNYTYFINREGTILYSGNEEFIGRNARDIEGVSNLIDSCIADLEAGSYIENPSYTQISYKPVKTLDGKMEVYYIVGVNKSCPDMMFLGAFPKESLDQNALDESFLVVGNRRIGLTGEVVIINKERTVINSFFGVHRYEPFPLPEMLDELDSGTGNNVQPVTLRVMRTSEIYEDIEKNTITGNVDLWDVDYYFNLCNYNDTVYILCIYPVEEAMSAANSTIFYIVLIEILVFSVLFIVLHLLIKRRVVKGLDSVNASLAEITNGNLEEKVDVRNCREFDVLSTDINATVDRLKEYIAEAEARFDADLTIAKSIQSSALPNVFPPFPDHREFELYASMNAAKEVGGDFYDFYMLGENTLGLLIADVSGKSIPGAMFMMTSKTVIKSLAESGMPPADVFTQANEKLCEGNEAEMFVTAWLGYLDLKTGLIRVANAGHNPPVLIRDGKAEYIKLRPGLMLAGMDGVRYKEQTVQLRKGDILYLYTDGVTEAMNKDEEQYGESRLQELLSFGESFPEPSEKYGIVKPVCDTVIADVTKFTAGAEQSDDITMLCIRYLGE